MSDLRAALEKYFGFSEFREGQEKVCGALMDGRPALALFPTGAGKSLCYQLPALLLPGTALVISPLIALMRDQVEALRARGLAAARLDSSLGLVEAQQVMADFRAGKLKLLYVSPERLTNEAFLTNLAGAQISLMAVDEAHCISEWGHNFRPEYLRLAMVAKQLSIQPVLCLTATATPAVAEDIGRAFGIADADRVVTTFHRPNLYLRVTPSAGAKRIELLKKRLAVKKVLPAIVYVTLQETAENVATQLAKSGIAARAYHAGLADEIRAEAQEFFMSGKCDVMVATIAFGMGIDKANIRAVFHYNLPKTLENYQQEIGRAGRDGRNALCEMLACADDCTVLENFIFGDTPSATAVRQVVDFLLRQGEEFHLSKYELAWANDVKQGVLDTILTLLELEGLIQPTYRFYEKWQMRFLRKRELILAGRGSEEREELDKILETGTAGPVWTTLTISEICEGTELSARQISGILGELESAGDAVVKVSGLREAYRRLPAADSVELDKLAARLFAQFQERESRDLERLAEVVSLAGHGGCLTRKLLLRFGEDLGADCAHCESCCKPGTTGHPLPSGRTREIGLEDVEVMQQLIKQRHPSLRTPRQLARYLCGISSPATIRERLTREDNFALLAEVPFQEVLVQLRSLRG